MSLEAKYNFEDLYNAAEELVFAELEAQLERADDSVPRDQDSVVDMAAFALNLVTPMYRANLLGRIYAPALSEEHHREIEKAVKKAIGKISNNPPD
jgi:competence protein ComFB